MLQAQPQISSLGYMQFILYDSWRLKTSCSLRVSSSRVVNNHLINYLGYNSREPEYYEEPTNTVSVLILAIERCAEVQCSLELQGESKRNLDDQAGLEW